MGEDLKYEDMPETVHDAVHAVRDAQQAVEMARQAQLHEAVEKTAARTKESLLEGLKEVFGDSEAKDPAQMKVLVHRIPILCTRIDAMDKNIEELRDGQTFAIRAILGGIVSIIVAVVVAAVLK